jgi:hypothetical protein
VEVNEFQAEAKMNVWMGWRKEKGEGDKSLYESSPITSCQTARDLTSQYVISLHEPRAQTGILYKALQPMFFTRTIKSSTRIQNTAKRHFNTKITLKMPLVVPGINSGGDNSKTQEWTDKLVGKKIGDSSDAVVRPSSCGSHLY